MQLIVAGHVDGADVRDVQLCRGHLRRVKVQRDVRDAVQRDDARGQLDKALVVAARLKLTGQVKVRHGQGLQGADRAGGTGHAQGLLAQRIVQTLDVEAVRRADEVHLQRQLPHLIDRQRDVGGVALHRDILRREGVALLVAQLQRSRHRRGVGQLAVHLDRGDDAGHLIQLARRAAQRDLGGHGGGLVQHIAAGDRHRGGVHRDGNGLFADLVKDDVDGARAFHRTLNVAGEVCCVRHTGLQAQRDLARAADTGVAWVDHDVGAADVADDRAVALDFYGHALNVGLFHNVQTLGRVGRRAARVVDRHAGHRRGALGVDVDRNDDPHGKAHDDCQNGGKHRVIPDRARALGRGAVQPRRERVIRVWHGSVRLPCAAAFAAARYWSPRPRRGERSPPAEG